MQASKYMPLVHICQIFWYSKQKQGILPVAVGGIAPTEKAQINTGIKIYVSRIHMSKYFGTQNQDFLKQQ
jgi:hypothetical protein